VAKALTDFAIKNMKPTAERREIPAGGRGLYLVVHPTGAKGFAVRYRVRGRPKKLTLGRWQSPADIGATKAAPEPKIGEPMSLASARKLAADTLLKVERGEDPAKRKTEHLTVDAILDDFVKRHVDKLRSADQITGALDRYVRPRIGSMSIYELKRREIVEMLDAIEDGAGPVMADRTLAYVRKSFNWQAARDDEFSSPIVKGMARTKPKERARKRVLSDDEIHLLWKALDTADVPSCYPRFVKSLLLLMTRRNESADMAALEIDGDVWTIPGERYKTKLDHVIPLTAQAKALIGGKPEGVKGNDWFIFSSTGGKRPFSGFSKAKAALDAEMLKIRRAERGENADDVKPIPHWTLHDLRRTARSLMSRAQVPADHAERAMGHVIGGVRETYDRHEYLDEKRVAFAALAEMVERIVGPAGA
jgi:integrase